MYDIQKASLLKRFSAFLLDFILMAIAVTGFAFLFSVITDYDSYSDTVNQKEAYYEELHGVDFDISEEDFNKLSEDEQNKINSAYDLFANDEEVLYAYNMMFNLMLTMTTLSILVATLLLEFVIPQIFKNGQTVGKKVFAIGVMQINGVRLTGVALFARTLIGKYTIETMIPVVLLMTMLFGSGGVVGVVVLGLILVLEIFVFLKNKNYTPIHDVIAHTITVDLPSQMIFENEQELIAYKAKLHNDASGNAE